MAAKPETQLDLETKQRTTATVYLVVSIGIIAGIAALWIYVFSGPAAQ